jgi:ribosomal protein S18 acetylase RimI-like enzyme
MTAPNLPALSLLYTRNCEGVNWSAVKSLYRLSQFDNGRSPSVLQSAFEGSHCVCFAYSMPTRSIIGTARAISDGVTCSAVFDVCVHPEVRRTGVGTELVRRLMLDLPGQFILLTTPVPEFYEKLGFKRTGEAMWKVC